LSDPFDLDAGDDMGLGDQDDRSSEGFLSALGEDVQDLLGKLWDVASSGFSEPSEQESSVAGDSTFVDLDTEDAANNDADVGAHEQTTAKSANTDAAEWWQGLADMTLEEAQHALAQGPPPTDKPGYLDKAADGYLQSRPDMTI
jgi:hypothetical protein